MLPACGYKFLDFCRSTEVGTQKDMAVEMVRRGIEQQESVYSAKRDGRSEDNRGGFR